MNGKIMGYSAILDYNFSYPLNVIYEIIAYQMASDFCRKYGSVEHLQTLSQRLEQLWLTFKAETNRRDDYQGERIGNVYRQTGNSYGGYY